MSEPIVTFPKKRNPCLAAVFSNTRDTALMLGWSGATPARTRPQGVGSESNMSTSTVSSFAASRWPAA